METIFPYILGWLVPTILGTVAGYLRGKLSSVKADRDEERKKMDRLQESMDFNTLLTCRMSIYDEHFSVDEKVDAYRKYRALGGNHQTKKHMDGLLGEDADAWLAKHE